jgi:hypothetical protein
MQNDRLAKEEPSPWQNGLINLMPFLKKMWKSEQVGEERDGIQDSQEGCDRF